MADKGVDVLLFNDCVSHGYIWSRSAGPYRIATELRKLGLRTQVVDWFSYLVLEDLELAKALLEKFVGPQTLYVGFSLTFFNNLLAIKRNRHTDIARVNRKNNIRRSTAWSVLPNSEIVELLEFIKTLNPNIKIVVGGAGLTTSIPYVDVICLGYGETHIIDYTQWLLGKNPFFQYRTVGNTIVLDRDVKAACFDFQSSTIEWTKEDCLLPNETLPIEVSRGCIFKCKFCSFPLNGKKKADHLKHEEVIYQELKRNYDLWGVTRYVFSDDTYNDSTAKLEMLTRINERLPFDLEFGTYARLDLIAAHPEQIDLLKSSGLKSVFFGIETLTHKAAKTIGKGLHPDKVVATLETLRNRWGHSILTNAGFIFGLPHDSLESIENWTETILDERFPLHSVSFGPLGLADINRVSRAFMSEFEKEPLKYGYTFPNKDDAYDWINTEANTTFKQMDALAARVSGYAHSIGRAGYSTQLIMSLVSVGISYDEIRLLGRKGIDDMLPAENRFYHQFYQYLNLLRELDDV